MLFQIIAGYKFVPLSSLEDIKNKFLSFCRQNYILGTILISQEGININLAATSKAIRLFKDYLVQHHLFEDINFRESFHETPPFKKLKIKLKKEIITFKNDNIHPWKKRAPSISPQTLKQWLDNKQDLLLLDARNDYEIKFGSFTQATALNLQCFSELPAKLPSVDTDVNIVTFCTSGIRCEKAALLLKEYGYKNVFQLDGGILNYFSQIGGAHYQGQCFVFDDRIAVDPSLKKCQLTLCKHCQAPVSLEDMGCHECMN